MKIAYGAKALRKRNYPSVVSVGVFDGVHIGHQRIIKELIKHSRRLKSKSAVVTFQNHPDNLLKAPDSVPMLTSLQHRLYLLDKLGVDICLALNFTRSFAEQSAEDFIRSLLIGKLNIKMIVAGENFSFGKERLRSRARLKEITRGMGLGLEVVRPRRFRSRTISSSYIRCLIENGDLKIASRLLGRPVSILGTVVKGRQRGRSIGFKTANINPHHEAIPPSGVYAVYSMLNKRRYKSVLNIGTRPTFDEKEPTIEVHLFGLNRVLYGKDIEVVFVKRLRAERRFKNKDYLRAQIARDAKLAEGLLQS